MSQGLYDAKRIIRRLQEAGFQAYLVGGCVRDQILGKEPKDYDVATNALPDQVMTLFPAGKPVGAAFGVILYGDIEIATFRSDGQYSDGRRPDSVQFQNDPKEDAARRDFTINSMFYDPEKQVILDFFNGLQDIKDKVIRTVGNPHERFEEDFLRMLRAIRFAARLNFTLDEETFFAIEANAGNIRDISKERITKELKLMFSYPGEGRVEALMLLRDSDLLRYIIPEAYAMADEPFERLVEMALAIKEEDPLYFLALIFGKIPRGAVEPRMRDLKFTNEEIDFVMGTLDLIDRMSIRPLPYYSPRGHVVKRIIRNKYFPAALKLYGYMVDAYDNSVDRTIYFGFSYLSKRLTQEELFPPKLVDGDTLRSMGIPQGPIYKKILTEIEDAQLRGDIRTVEQAVDIALQLSK